MLRSCNHQGGKKNPQKQTKQEEQQQQKEKVQSRFKIYSKITLLN